ncbi:hypothetical protein Y032_0008g22 [Ancylostoma ceylanicum]|uniref:Uncharacterized protein n=1 Tax=Ancylostoma ceylanicum TaxID=53326 RepID=A0A016VKM9_9BILA|nr:hypothetical protein Y032_0008g22 [Ancylostoma ceylanicum]
MRIDCDWRSLAHNRCASASQSPAMATLGATLLEDYSGIVINAALLNLHSLFPPRPASRKLSWEALLPSCEQLGGECSSCL